MNNKFFVSCGEMSGDLHLSYIIRAIKKADAGAEFFGMAGDKSASEGAVLIQHIKDNDIMGFAEAVKKYKYFKKMKSPIELIYLAVKFDRAFISLDHLV